MRSWLPFDFKAALLKGRSNYVSLRRLNRYLNAPSRRADGSWSSEEARFKLRMLVWLEQTSTGDRSEIKLNGLDELFWLRAASTADYCLARHCDNYRNKTCFYWNSRRAAQDADLIVTLKNYYRRKDSPLREAEADGIPIQVLKSNTITQIRNALSKVYQLDTPDPTESALQETIEGINRAKATNAMVELSPQTAYVRRLQHQLVERHELTARSTGKEPNRRLRIYTSSD